MSKYTYEYIDKQIQLGEDAEVIFYCGEEFVRISDIKKLKDVLCKLIDNQKVRGYYYNDYSLIEYGIVRTNIDRAFELLLKDFEG